LDKAACIGFGFAFRVQSNNNPLRLNMPYVRVVAVDDRPTAEFGRDIGSVQENNRRPLICGIGKTLD
jgi:hypothetical protein